MCQIAKSIRYALITLSLLLSAFLNAHAALNLSDPIPIGPQVKVGKLDNGLTYYIQKHSQPAKKVELRLIIKAGSVLEDEDQRGVAHFVEHMAFNGSAHFQKHELISYLQSIGVKFGPDLNAMTSFNETVYMLPVPTDKKENLDKAFLVLEDWAQGLTFKDADIEAERGIILEEARLRKGFQDRVQKAMFPKLFDGSKYAKRMPIGDEEIIKTVSPDTIRRFYRDWYRPNLMAVVVVGDIEPIQAQTLIEAHFGKMKNPPNEKVRENFSIPQRTTTEVMVVADKEAPADFVSIQFSNHRHEAEKTFGEYRQLQIERLIQVMLASRMAEATQQLVPPYVMGQSVPNKSMAGHRSFHSFAVVGRRGYGTSLDALFEESERARLFGFSQDELDRAKANRLRTIENLAAEKDKAEAATYAAEYTRAFLVQEFIPGIVNEFVYHRELLPTVTLEEVNRLASKFIPASKEPKLVLLAAGIKAGVEIPTEQAFMKRLEEAEKVVVQAKEQKAVAKQLMATVQKPGSIVAERKNPQYGMTELELSNGVKVILMPTDFKDDQILIDAVRRGGQSLYPLKDMYNAMHATELAGAMGLGDFTPMDVQKILAGKSARLSTSLGLYSDHVRGNAAKADLETLLQILYLKFQPPRKDSDLFTSTVTRTQDALKNVMAMPQNKFNDAVNKTIYDSNLRLVVTPRDTDFDLVKLPRVLEIYADRFSSAKGMTFILVGSFDPQEIKPLLATYLANLPSGEIPAEFVDLKIRPVTVPVKKEVQIGVDNKATVSINFAGLSAFSEKNQFVLDAVKEIVQIKMTDVLREKMSLIYAVGVGSNFNLIPVESYQFSMTLPCAPQNTEKVIAAALGEIKKIQENGPEPGDLEKFKANWRVTHRKALRDNVYWSRQIQTSALHQRTMVPSEVMEKLTDELTVKDIQDAANLYLQEGMYIQVVAMPEAK